MDYFFHFSSLFPAPYIKLYILISYLNFKVVLELPKTACSAQTHKSISFNWIVWRTLYEFTMKIRKELMYKWRSLSNLHLPWLCKLHKMQSWLEIPHRTSWGKCLDTEMNIYYWNHFFQDKNAKLQTKQTKTKVI